MKMLGSKSRYSVYEYDGHAVVCAGSSNCVVISRYSILQMGKKKFRGVEIAGQIIPIRVSPSLTYYSSQLAPIVSKYHMQLASSQQDGREVIGTKATPYLVALKQCNVNSLASSYERSIKVLFLSK